MSISYIRQYYGVPAKIGMKVSYRGRECWIVGTSGPHLKLRSAVMGVRYIVHPKDVDLRYMDAAK